MNASRLFRIASGIAAAACGIGAAGLYVAWTHEFLGPMDSSAANAALGTYLLFALILVLAAQACTGLPAWRLSTAWNSLRGWQRGLIGTAIVVMAFYLGHVLFLDALEQRGMLDQNAIP